MAKRAGQGDVKVPTSPCVARKYAITRPLFANYQHLTKLSSCTSCFVFWWVIISLSRVNWIQNNSLLTFRGGVQRDRKSGNSPPVCGDPCLAWWHPVPLVVLGNTKVLGDRLQGPSRSNYCQQCYRTPSSIRATKYVISDISFSNLEFGAMSF